MSERKFWTASFDSYDQRTESAYYCVTFQAALHSRTFISEIYVGDLPLGILSPELIAALMDRLSCAARLEGSNTLYTGNIWPRHE
ncbi:hypothetical protein [Streptomyces bobili]|uniref:hypothetical protein n=1 Tax=Streptomyces bobili TaxID=67280 RepID=UPI003803C5D7